MKASKIIPIVTLVALLFASCDENKMIKGQIKKKKAQVVKLEKEIEELEKQVSDSQQVNLVPVRVKNISGEAFNHYIIVFGEVEAEDYALISPEMAGQVKDIHVDEGQYVKQGALLVSLNTESIESAVQQIKTNLDLATETFEKQNKLWENNVGSEMQFKQAKANKESLEAQLKSLQAQKEMAKIRAPFSGYVNQISLKRGELASPGMPVVEMVNLGQLSVTADVSEEHIGKIKEGEKVDVSFTSMPDVHIQTPIIRKSNMIDARNRTFQIELKFSNRGEKIKPNMVSKITINDFSSDNAIVLPSLVIKQDITGKYVYTISNDKGKEVAKKTYIKTGLSYEDKTMVTEGLDMDDRVVTDGHNLVSSGVPVEIKN
jgi:membrane fusion protein, multidrug efflux system